MEPLHVLVDTQIFRGSNFCFEHVRFKELSGLVRDGRVVFLTTSVVRNECRTQIDKLARESINKLKALLKKDYFLKGFEQSSHMMELCESKESAIQERLQQFDEYLDLVGAVELETNEVSVDDLLRCYFEGSLPFSSGKKKDEFPDAINVFALLAHKDKEGLQEVFVLSGDRDFKGLDDVIYVGSVSKLKAIVEDRLIRFQQNVSRQRKILRERAEEEVIPQWFSENTDEVLEFFGLGGDALSRASSWGGRLSDMVVTLNEGERIEDFSVIVDGVELGDSLISRYSDEYEMIFRVWIDVKYSVEADYYGVVGFNYDRLGNLIPIEELNYVRWHDSMTLGLDVHVSIQDGGELVVSHFDAEQIYMEVDFSKQYINVCEA